MLRWLALGAGCVLTGGIGTAAGLYMAFPSEKAAEYAEWRVHSANDDYALEVGGVHPWWLPGVAADDVTFYTVKKARRKKDQEGPTLERVQVLQLDRLAVRAQLLPLLLGKTAVSYQAELLGGSIDGAFARSDTAMELEFEIDELDLGAAPIEKDDLSVSLLGTLSGKADLVLDTEDVKASTGGLELSFDGLKLGAGSKVMGIELPAVSFSTAGVKLEVQQGKLEVIEGKFDGDLIDMELSGDISLNKKLERSRNRLELVVTLPEDLDKLASIAPPLKRSRDEEGGFHFSIGGTVLSPTFRPGRGTGKSSRSDRDGEESPSKPRLLSGEEGGVSEDDPEAAREERRKRREERIKERRERLKKRREEAAQTRGDGAVVGDGEGDMMGGPMDDLGDGRGPRDDDGGGYGDDMGPPDDFEYPDNDMGPGRPMDGMPDGGPPGNENPPDFEE
ncbi:MAG: type II secretion system protein GspN [Deltaproteobacteria bacterium]|nr:type II secretion system protein GspN [Deltaproteobacteria bacterium]